MLLTLSFNVFAGPPANKSADTVFNGLRTLLPRMCDANSTLRACFLVNKDTCLSRLDGTFENCLRDQRIRYAGQNSFDAKTAGAVEQDLKTCVLNGYTALSMNSYRKTPACESMVPKIKKALADAKRPVEVREHIFEDPLEDQRDIVGRYKLRLLNDLRLADDFKKKVQDRKNCGKTESSINCFKRELAGFALTSSAQITQLTVVATALFLRDKEAGHSDQFTILADVILSIAERVQLSEFHLARLEAKSEVDRAALQALKNDDEKLLTMQNEKIVAIIQSKLPTGSRQPANLSNIMMRLQALKKTKWTY